MEKAERPKTVTDEHLTFLDELRESGATNMYGAAPWLEEAFVLDREVAREVLLYWMQSFSERHA